MFPADAAINALEMVLLMTPENIHLNAFIHEPILDMSDDHLKKLYKDVAALSSEPGSIDMSNGVLWADATMQSRNVSRFETSAGRGSLGLHRIGRSM